MGYEDVPTAVDYLQKARVRPYPFTRAFAFALDSMRFSKAPTEVQRHAFLTLTGGERLPNTTTTVKAAL